MKRYIHTNTAAKKLNCSQASVVNYIKRGWLQGHKFMARWLVDYESLKKLMNLKIRKEAPHGRGAADDK